VAVVAGGFESVSAFLAFVGLLSLHVSVNARGEYLDYKSGIDLETDPTPFSGGTKTLPKGELDPIAAKRLGNVTAGIGAVIGGYFLIDVGLVMLPLIVLGAVAVLFYTSHLTKLGLGELFAGLGLGGLPVIGIALVQIEAYTPVMILAAIPSTLMTFNLLLLNEFPDQGPDERGGRKNLIHRFGRKGAAMIYFFAAVAVPGSILAGWLLGLFPIWAMLGAIPSVLLAGPIGWALGNPQDPVPVDALRDNVLWILATNTFLGVGLLVPVLL
jgi:1,4-dihydroxy-2-naphthoate octaprenyltransferase